MRYISDGTWFKKGTPCELIDDYRPAGLDIGLFEGTRISENEASEGVPEGISYTDQEVCGFDEFSTEE
jgi:hypothetical protein